MSESDRQQLSQIAVILRNGYNPNDADQNHGAKLNETEKEEEKKKTRELFGHVILRLINGDQSPEPENEAGRSLKSLFKPEAGS